MTPKLSCMHPKQSPKNRYLLEFYKKQLPTTLLDIQNTATIIETIRKFFHRTCRICYLVDKIDFFLTRIQNLGVINVQTITGIPRLRRKYQENCKLQELKPMLRVERLFIYITYLYHQSRIMVKYVGDWLKRFLYKNVYTVFFSNLTD